MRDLATISLRDLVPESIRDDANVSAAMQALDDEIRMVSAECTAPIILARIDEQTSAVLDHLAWQLNSKVWRSEWPVELKRSVIKSIIIEQAKKGTRFAVDKAVRSFGAALSMREWWEIDPPGTPHTFDLVLSINDLGGELVTEETQEDLLRRIDEVKPERSQYTWSLAVQAEGGLGLQGALRPVSYARLQFHEDAA